MELNIIKNRYTYFAISALLLVISLGVFMFWNINYWIDMTWWTQAEYQYETKNLDLDKIRVDLNKQADITKYNEKNIINWISVFKISWQNKIWIITWYDEIIPTKNDLKILNSDSKITKTKIIWEIQAKIKADFREKTLIILEQNSKNITETNYTNIGKSFGDYIKNTAILTLIIAIIAIAIYVMNAFSWVASWISIMSFAIITVWTLFHDVLASTGLYLMTSIYFPEFKIDTFFITALLTILWYSINDTIVVFDRIRSNIKKLVKKKTLKEIIEISIKDTLRRSIFTSLTVFFVLLTIFFFWPETIKGFILTMLFGTIIWTYSSIFIASPLLFEFNKNKKLSEYKVKIVKPEDKIVV